MTTIVADDVLRRYEAADEVCHTLVLAMHLGLLHVDDQGERDFLAQPLLAWCQEAVATGAMRPAKEDA